MTRLGAVVLDVDGVLTDGGISLDGGTGEIKRFHAQDGVGIKLAQMVGWAVMFLTARHSLPARRRAEELGAEWAVGVARKDLFLETWLPRRRLGFENVAYVGDDLPDLALLRRVGWPVAVANAVEEVKAVARYVTVRRGGEGAVREAIEWLLEDQGLRGRAVEAFLARAEGFAVGPPAASAGSEETGGP